MSRIIRPAIAMMIHPKSLGDILSQTSYQAKVESVRLACIIGLRVELWFASFKVDPISNQLLGIVIATEVIIVVKAGVEVVKVVVVEVVVDVVVEIGVILIARSTSSISGGMPGMF